MIVPERGFASFSIIEANCWLGGVEWEKISRDERQGNYTCAPPHWGQRWGFCGALLVHLNSTNGSRSSPNTPDCDTIAALGSSTMSDLIGRTLGHYRIVEKIGEGGMGEVYRAHDERLDRDVAVKVLHEAVAQDVDRLARFEREAKAVAKLDHPNILAIHDFGSDEGVTFAVMELLEGESLREVIRGGGLTHSKAVEYARSIADGLAAAHDKGIVHRDLKPENVFLTQDGRIKILDFGLAKLKLPEQDLMTETPTATLDTAPGGLLGTVAYMAPEQVQGQPADHRSDIFALGCVLHEMLSGTRPFEGKTAAETAAAILRDEPPAVLGRVTNILPGLDTIVSHCLEKRPEERFQSARDLSFALRATSPIPRTPPVEDFGRRPIRSIAVLPFEIAGGNEEMEYLGDGLTEGIIGKLCGLSGIDRVIARHSVFRYKGKEIDPTVVGEELGVDSVLVSDVNVRGDEILIATELVATPRGDRIWGNRYVRELSGIIDLEDAISRAIAESLRLELSDADHARIIKRPTRDTEAYRLYLKGRHLWNRRTREALDRSIELYREAISRDRNFALAHTGIADSWVSLSWNDFLPKRTAFKDALSAALTALEIDDHVSESHVSLGMVLSYFGTDWSRAEKEYRRALEINRNNADACHQYAHLLTFLGRTDEGIEMMRRAVDFEPASRIISSCCGQVLYFARRFDEAVSHLETAIELDPGNAGPYSWLGMVHVEQREFAKAEDAFERGLEADSFVPRNTGALGYCYGLQGEKAKALAQLERLSKLAPETSVDACFEAWIHAGIGEREGALDALEKAYHQDANWLVSLKVDPFLADLRTDPRFLDLLRRMNFEED
jgi:serine/threonine protein kinase/tetratricopeptide (TPR) repeat protein